MSCDSQQSMALDAVQCCISQMKYIDIFLQFFKDPVHTTWALEQIFESTLQQSVGSTLEQSFVIPTTSLPHASLLDYFSIAAVIQTIWEHCLRLIARQQ